MTRTGLLTPSEHTVLVLVANGRRPREIAAEQGLVVATIRCHLRRANRALGTRSAAQAVAAALFLGEIRPSEIVLNRGGRHGQPTGS